MSLEKSVNNSDTQSIKDSDLHVDVSQINHFGIPEIKTRKEWYHTNNPQLRSYITGNLSASISGKGSKSLQRAADEYQHLSEEFSRRSYSPKAMSKKYDNFNGIDSSVLDIAIENENNKFNNKQDQFNSGEINKRRFNRLQQRHQRRINNLNENYKTLAEVKASKSNIPLVKTQSSVSSAPFLLGTIGLPAAIIGGISGGAAAAPYLGKALANPWVQRGLTGLDVVDTGVQVASGNYLGAAANWIPFGEISKKMRKSSEFMKNLYNRYTAPRTNIKHTPYKGDQYQLTKFRLVNGGFDKLGISPTDVVYVPKGHPMYSPPVNKYALLDDSPVNARQYLLKSEAVPLREEVPGIAYYSHSAKIYTQPSYGKVGKLDGKTKFMTAHEFTHAIDDVVHVKNHSSATQAFEQLDISPSGIKLDKDIDVYRWVKPPGTDFSQVPSRISRYFRKHGGTELHARLAQIKNWYGITDPHQPITPEMWNYARRHYVSSMGGFDNNMQQMFRVVTDPKKFLDWINPRVAVQAGAIGTVGLSTLKTDEK